MTSRIEWTDVTWNPMTGCTKVSQGCKHCYAERQWPRLAKMIPAYAGREFSDVRCHPDRLDQPLHWKRPRKVFVNSMSDLFHPDVPFEFIDQVFAVMALAPQHTFQVLTKRPERMQSYFFGYFTRHKIGVAAKRFTGKQHPQGHDCDPDVCNMDFPLKNAWLGVSVEDQATAEERIPLLLDTPAAVRWISAEPLLGPVDLTRILVGQDKGEDFGGWGKFDCVESWVNALNGNALSAERRGETLSGKELSWHTGKLDWVVVGGESGPKARPMDPDWARSLRDQCAAAGVPFLFKQWGEWIDDGNIDSANLHAPQISDPDEYFNEFDLGEGLSSWRVGKKAAGRRLDWVTHDGYPERQS